MRPGTPSNTWSTIKATKAELNALVSNVPAVDRQTKVPAFHNPDNLGYYRAHVAGVAIEAVGTSTLQNAVVHFKYMKYSAEARKVLRDLGVSVDDCTSTADAVAFLLMH